MSININCTNRIKPKLLREQKTEALLVFIRTTLEQHFHMLKKDNLKQISFGTKEDTEYIYTELNKLLDNLKETVVNSSYLISVVENSSKNKVLNLLAQKEKPMMIYYNSIVKNIEKDLAYGTKWIPELLVVSLLSNWILEEEKSTYLYPFLNEIDYLDLIDRFDRAKLEETQEKKDVVMNMYNLSVKLIDSLKKSTYKSIQKNKKRKRRK